MKIRKRLWNVLMILCLFLAVCAVHAVAVDRVEYPVTGGNLHFDPSSGKIVDCDESVTEAVLPLEIDGVAVTGIGTSAFYGCKLLTHIVIPSNTTSIENFAFSDCKKLTSAGPIGSGCNIEFGWADTIPDKAFCGCQSLTSVKVPDGVSAIGNYAFSASGLTSIEIPVGVLSIGREAFFNCSDLANVTIPNSVVSMGFDVFSKCQKLISAGPIGSGCNIEFGWTDEIPAYTFGECTSLVNIEIPNGITAIGAFAFDGCIALSNVKFSDEVTRIGACAFRGCLSLQTICIPTGVTQIDPEAFWRCTGLKEITLPDSVIEIGYSAFSGCTALASFKAGANLEMIGYSCFSGCTSLSEVKLNEGLTTIGDNTFDGADSLTRIVIPDTVTLIGSGCFRKCSKLSDVYLPDGLKEIPSSAFAQCYALTEIEIPKGVTTIGSSAFEANTKLTKVTMPVTITQIADNAFSYPTKMTAYGCKGSYAEEWANTKGAAFVDITKSAESISLANGKNRLTIGNGINTMPEFVLNPADSTDAIQLSVTEGNGVYLQYDGTLWGSGSGRTAKVTATTTSGASCTFQVTVTELTDIVVDTSTVKTEYGLKENKDLSGLRVYAVFDNGDREEVKNYTTSGFSTDSIGTKTVTVTYGSNSNVKSASFDIYVVKTETGYLGQNQEVAWSYNSKNGTITATGQLSTQEPIYVASYDENGRFLSVEILSTSGQSAEINAKAQTVQMLWLGVNNAPKCQDVRIDMTTN